MAKFHVDWFEKKNEDWVVLTLSGEEGKHSEVSVNRVNKKGETFPNFDSIANGGEIEGELWQSGAGKWYLFAPKQPKSGAFTKKLAEEKQAIIEGSVGRVLDRKEHSIALAGAQRDAVLLVTTFYKDIAEDPILGEQERETLLKKKIVQWRDYLLSKDFTDVVPF